MCELLHTLNASFLECGEHAVCTERRAVAFSAGGDGVSGRLTCRSEIDGHCLPVSALIDDCMFELIASRMQPVISTMS